MMGLTPAQVDDLNTVLTKVKSMVDALKNKIDDLNGDKPIVVSAVNLAQLTKDKIDADKASEDAVGFLNTFNTYVDHAKANQMSAELNIESLKGIVVKLKKNESDIFNSEKELTASKANLQDKTDAEKAAVIKCQSVETELGKANVKLKHAKALPSRYLMPTDIQKAELAAGIAAATYVEDQLMDMKRNVNAEVAAANVAKTNAGSDVTNKQKKHADMIAAFPNHANDMKKAEADLDAAIQKGNVSKAELDKATIAHTEATKVVAEKKAAAKEAAAKDAAAKEAAAKDAAAKDAAAKDAAAKEAADAKAAAEKSALAIDAPSSPPAPPSPSLPMSVGVRRDPFEKLFGFTESNPLDESSPTPESIYKKVKAKFEFMGGTQLKSNANGRMFQIGELHLLSLGELRTQLTTLKNDLSGYCTLRHEIVGDIFNCHHSNPDAVFQVASQFNLLEMAESLYTPERGVTIYHDDPTQGPACALACMAATVYRNYFVDINGMNGQTKDNQINALKLIFDFIQNDKHQFLTMTNGYVNSLSIGKLQEMYKLIATIDPDGTKRPQRLQVGVHRNVGVDFATRPPPTPEHLYEYKEITTPVLVTQVFCSAIGISHSAVPEGNWEQLAKMILDATYQATIAAAILHFDQKYDQYKTAVAEPRQKVFLTLVGGGDFGNRNEWIADAINKAVKTYQRFNLDIIVGHYKSMREYNTSGTLAYIPPLDRASPFIAPPPLPSPPLS